MYAKNGIHKLPSSLSSLFQRKEPFSKSLASYLVKEPFQRKSKLDDESIKDFFERRFGSEIATYLVDAFCRGIYAGKSSELSIKSCFPSLFASDKKYGSVIHPWWNAVKARRKAYNLRRRKISDYKQLLEGPEVLSKRPGKRKLGLQRNYMN
ncbi:Protoporphyrinogen oxidase [Holothuria leucospilota]|uniref:Protoporphyrinogen oxidase n=1 Tax=Holothuria leucospilota TaxID=206669 RepID=A0A9Q0YBB3_HOLLE|nr:Protoporphyrinogen oxidase [Holothuria leucospilota]